MRTGRGTIRFAGGLAFALVALAPMAGSAQPVMPSGASITAGSAAISAPSETSTLITQSSQKAIINWKSFSIGTGASVTFQQPNSAAITLNRVTGPTPSTINGNLLANGQVWLINGNGILFGKGSSINVGGLIATTSDMRDTDFMAGHYDFGVSSNNPNAQVVNQGSIKAAAGGSAVLAGSRVENLGVIEANLGKVVLAGSNAFSVDFDGDNLIRFAITAPVSETPMDADGKPAPDLVSNSGKIAAEGGKVMLTARAARNVVDSVINSTGIIEARTASIQNGEIVLDAGEGGTVNVAGLLDASGKGPSETGGTVSVLADTVTVADGAKIDASGDAGGGTVLVGGNLHGVGPEPNALAVNVGKAEIAADATGTGNGGTVAIFSTGQTKVAGTLSAKGGAHGGNGGTVETSGHDLNVTSGTHVDTSAANGVTGDWLLDPVTINVATGGVTPLPPGGVIAVGDATPTTVAPSAITDALTGGTNVRLEASGSITVNNPVIYNSPNSLTFLSQGAINFYSSVQNQGSGAISAIAGWDGTTPAATILANLATSTAYGATNGFITVYGLSSGSAVGSKGGATTLAGWAIGLFTGPPGAYAQVGYYGTGAIGAINVYAKSSDPPAADTSAYHTGYTTCAVPTAGVICFVSGFGGSGDGTYTQIGHLGRSGDGTASGNITVNATGNLMLFAGGLATPANDPPDDAHRVPGTNTNAYALIGNGSPTNVDSVSGTIDVRAIGTIFFDNSTVASSLAAIGNRAAVGGTASGNVRVIAADFKGTTGNSGDIDVAPVFLTDIGTGFGNGGDVTLGLTGSNDHFLDTPISYNSPHTFTLAAKGGITFTAPFQNNDIGSISFGAGWDGVTDPITIVSTFGAGTFGLGGHSIVIGGAGASGNVAVGTGGGITTLTGANLTLQAVNGYAQLGHHGSATGSVEVFLTGNLSLAGGGTAQAFAQIGNGGYGTSGSSSGTIVIDTFTDLVTSGSVTLAGGSNDNTYAQIGHGGGQTNVSATADFTQNGLIEVVAGGNVTLTAGTGNASYVQIGNGGFEAGRNLGAAKATNTGLIEVFSEAGAVTLTGNGRDAYAQIGNGGGRINTNSASGARSETSGDIYVFANLLTGNELTMTAGAGLDAYAQIGNGGYAANTPTAAPTGNFTIGGNIYVYDLALRGGNVGANAYSQIGNGDASLNGTANVSGNITITGINGSSTISLTDGTASHSPALIGNAIGVGTVSGTVSTTGFGTPPPSSVVTVTADSKVKVYGTENPTLTVTITGIPSGDTISGMPSLSTTATASSPVGNYPITVGLGSLVSQQNNSFQFVNGTLSVGAKTVTASLTGAVSKTYNGTTAATLAPGNYLLTGLLQGDIVTVSNTVGSYDNKNVGTEKQVSVIGLALSGPAAGNYVLSSASVSAAIGTISPKALTPTLIGTVAKTYDGTTAATLGAGNYSLPGAAPGDNLVLNNPTSGTYDNKTVGTGKQVSVTGLTLSGTDAGNYTLTATTASGAVGTINAAKLTAALTGSVSKVYDGTTTATLAANNYTLSGAVLTGENVALNTSTTGNFDSKNVGTGKQVTVLGLTLTGSDASNYALTSTSVSAAIGAISAKALTAALTGTVSKVYNGTTAATLAPGNYTLSGAVTGDSVTLNNTVGSYDTKNVGTGKQVSVSGLTLSGANAGNYILSTTSLSGAVGTITPATLSVALAGTISKTYDGTTTAPLSSGNLVLSGAVAGDSVALSATNGTFDSRNVGTGKQVSVSGLTLSGTDAGNYALAATSLSGVGTINAVTLTAGLTGAVSKTFDGTTAATLTPANYVLSGVVAGDSVTLNNPASGTYDTSAVGTGKQVSVSGLALAGADSGNYALVSSGVSATIGEIKPSVADNGAIAVLTQPPVFNEIVTLTIIPAAVAVPDTGMAMIASMMAMMQNPIQSEGAQDEPAPPDEVANSVGQSLDGTPGSVPSRAVVLIGGLLSQVVPAAGASTPRGVPSADQNYSSWGNSSFWEQQP